LPCGSHRWRWHRWNSRQSPLSESSREGMHRNLPRTGTRSRRNRGTWRRRAVIFAMSSKLSRKQICQAPMSIPTGGFGRSVACRKYVELRYLHGQKNWKVDQIHHFVRNSQKVKLIGFPSISSFVSFLSSVSINSKPCYYTQNSNSKRSANQNFKFTSRRYMYISKS
jgi:hypothetical protein